MIAAVKVGSPKKILEALDIKKLATLEMPDS